MQSAGRIRFLGVAFAAGLFAACGGAPAQEPAPPPAPPAPAPLLADPLPPAAPAAEAPPAVTAATAAADAPIVLKDDFMTPECVIHDVDQDVYLVSNINGSPLEVDDNGYIAKVSPEGKVTEARFIDGAKADVKLNAPKGLTFAGDKLYVADITFVRIFDRKTGAPAGEVEVKGSTFLNGMTTGPDGAVYVSDSGLKLGKDGFEGTGTDAVYRIDPQKKNKLTPVAKSKDLGRPNGLAADQSGVWVVTFGSGELYRLSPKGQKEAAVKLPKGQLDGVVALDGGSVMVSSWEGQAVYRGTGAGAFEPIVSDFKSPASIGYDAKRKRLLIPSFMGNLVQITPVK